MYCCCCCDRLTYKQHKVNKMTANFIFTNAIENSAIFGLELLWWSFVGRLPLFIPIVLWLVISVMIKIKITYVNHTRGIKYYKVQ